MKKKLLSLIYFLACIFSVQAQTLYGLTHNGGSDGAGALIKFIPATNSLTVVKSFEIYASHPYYTNFIQASDGKLYGMTNEGGNNSYGVGDGYGVIFSFDPSSSTYTKLKAFDDFNGRNPYGSLVQASDGKLYGMTIGGGSSDYGVIFSFDPLSSTYTRLKDFDGTNGRAPKGSLVQASNGKLYGMTSEGGSNAVGVLFSFDPSSSTYTNLKDFGGANGSTPYGSLVQASDGKLYGMTTLGGSSDYGVIFSFDPASSTYTKLKDFGRPDGTNPFGSLMQASDGKLYGMTGGGGNSYGYGVIFSFDPSSFTYTKLKDFDNTNGSFTRSNLMQASDGKLYGMTTNGGSRGAEGGVIFSFDPSTSVYTKLVDLDRTKGNIPYGSLMQANNGKLYGMTNKGGSPNFATSGSYDEGRGVIFSFELSSSTYTKLMNLDANDGGNPSGAPLKAGNGRLYGMTHNGGSNAGGVIFCFDPSSSTYTKLWDFDGTNGAHPFGSLIQANDGKLYGITSAGGSGGGGVIFFFDPSTSTYTKLADVWGTPLGSLMQATDGKFYGMTYGGQGVMFSFDPSTSKVTYIYFGPFSNGDSPTGNFIQANDGKLYGMTSGGGSRGDTLTDMGVIFSLDPLTGTYTKLKDFEGPDGTNPYGSLMQASDGKLYGMTTSGGSNYYGVIFSYDPLSSTYTKLKDFNEIIGAIPYGSLMQASNGKLYGMTSDGGSNNDGVIFSYDHLSSTYTKLKDFNGTNGAFPFWGSAFIEVSGTLPVTLISFTGKNNGTINQLAWKVENEQDLNSYELQRGTDGKHFTNVGQIKATGNKSYTYDDPISTKVSSVYYYRLKIINKNGTYTYSPICTIRFNAANIIISISPNPVTKSVRLETSSGGLLTGNSATATIRIYSSSMQLLKSKKISATDGNAISIPVEKLASGIYYLQLVNGRDNSVLKFVKE